MKRIGITQRVELIEKYAERRDCLDQRWTAFACELNGIAIPLPNIMQDKVADLLTALNLDIIIFTGGNSLAFLSNNCNDVALERDEFEESLLNEAMLRSIPVVGICRGMQVINHHFGGRLKPINEHIATRHSIYSLNKNYQVPDTVNSFHAWGIAADDLAESLNALAVDSDGNVEALMHNTANVLGIMWHPEREEPFNTIDIKLFERLLV